MYTKIKILFVCFFISLKSFGQSDNSLSNCGKTREKEALANLYDVEKKNKEIDYFRNWTNCVIGKKMPDFEVKTIDNELISSSSLSGKIIVINFWDTSCKPCVAELPQL